MVRKKKASRKKSTRKGPSVEKRVQEALAKHTAGNGHKCKVCQLPDKETFERAAREYARQYRAAQESGGRLRVVAWSTFVRETLRKEFDFPHDYKALRSHMEKCLGEKIDE